MAICTASTVQPGVRLQLLEVLREAGLVMMADVGPGRTLYEAADAWHHHFVCRHCGVVVDVGCLRGMKPCLGAELPGTFIDEAQVIFRRTCRECATGVEGA